jgi:hypothetical protein
MGEGFINIKKGLKMGRPKGSKDLMKRSGRNQFGFSLADANKIRLLRNKHLTFSEIEEKTGLTYTQIKKICKDFDIKTISSVELSEKLAIDFKTKQCGVYVIEIRQKNGYAGYYVGSSVNIAQRYSNHLSALNSNIHYNTVMQSHYNNRLSINCYVWCLEDEKNLLLKESGIIASYCGLYNKWRNVDAKEVMRELVEAAERFTENRYVVMQSGCWEWKSTNHTGYGRAISIRKDGVIRYFIPHRVSIFKHRGEYPELVRHKCNNRRCVNPEHLEGGSYRENARDKRDGAVLG